MTVIDSTTAHYRTSDMALASFLKLEGHDCQDIQLQGDTCYWMFLSTPNLVERIEAFRNERVLVDLKAYNRIFGLTKREFYDLSDDPANRRQR